MKIGSLQELVELLKVDLQAEQAKNVALTVEVDRLKGILDATRKGMGTAVPVSHDHDRESWIREYNQVRGQRDSLLSMIYDRTCEVQLLEEELRSLTSPSKPDPPRRSPS